MADAAAMAVAPLYLFACILLGGSDQPSWHDAVLEVAGVLVMILAVARPTRGALAVPARRLLVLAMVAIAVIALQDLRLAASLSKSDPRLQFAGTYQLLGQVGAWKLGWLPPNRAVGALLAIIPPLSTFCAVLRLGPPRPGWLVAALIAGTFGGVLSSEMHMGAVQQTAWYTYNGTTWGGAHIFSNGDHIATLLVITFPFIAALAPRAEPKDRERYSGMLLISGALSLLTISGLALTGSLAGYVLAFPVIAASALILLPWKSPFRRPAAALAILLLVAAIASLTMTAQVRDTTTDAGDRTLPVPRPPLVALAKAISDQLPFGSGLGSFGQVYGPYRKDNRVEITATHAANDYAEAALELGLPGIALILTFLGWCVVAARSVWRNKGASSFAQGASIAVAAILLDSLVDFPLRTAAISASFAASLALLAGDRVIRLPAPVDLRPTRHLVFD